MKYTASIELIIRDVFVLNKWGPINSQEEINSNIGFFPEKSFLGFFFYNILDLKTGTMIVTKGNFVNSSLL